MFEVLKLFFFRLVGWLAGSKPPPTFPPVIPPVEDRIKAPQPPSAWPMYTYLVSPGTSLTSLVNMVQKRLNDLGYKCDVDGDYGPQTTAEVKAFQLANSIGQTGSVGSQTWAVLFSDAAKKAPTLPPHGGSGHGDRPAVDLNLISQCPNFAGRNGTAIDTIILHNTEGSLQSAIDRFDTASEQVSAHFIISRVGKCVQMVDESNTAWHSGDHGVNVRSIGIENVAGGGEGQGLTAAQELVLVAWCKYLMAAYRIPLSAVLPHRQIVSTSCPGSIWLTDSEFEAWKQKHLV